MRDLYTIQDMVKNGGEVDDTCRTIRNKSS